MRSQPASSIEWSQQRGHVATATISEIIANAQTIHTNARVLPHKWDDSEERERILMELRHDLQDALKAVIALEEEIS